MNVDYLWLIPVLPLLGAILNGLLAFTGARRLAGWIGCGSVGLAFVIAVLATVELAGLPAHSRVLTDLFYTWISSGNFTVDFAFHFDPLSAVMALVVTGVGFLIHVYSTGYMHGDAGYAKYFAFVNLFIFAMAVLILSDNMVGLFLGWEGVGLCSYLLIGFWYEDKEKADAGKKAFIVNRIGDAGVIFGTALMFWYFGTTKIPQVQELVVSHGGSISPFIVTLICLGLFVGATGKSAQIPLYVWLPDAMAGPTPVSALIHAATMVTAGVYLIARLNFLYVLSPLAMGVVAGVGVVTAFWAALIAFTQNDIKKVLAYSTVSQLGFMFIGVGVGAFTAGIFHLMTHAFFKACLFLGSGAVIHYLHGEQDIRKMGGLRHGPGMGVVFWSWIAATLAICGLPFVTSGFFSKDEILWMALSSERGAPWIYGLGALTAVFTAVYMWRLTWLTFFGESRADHHALEHPHKPGVAMWGVLAVLGVLSIVGGWVGIPKFLGGAAGIPNLLEHWLEPVFEHGHVGIAAALGGEEALHGLETNVFIIGLLIPLIGIPIGIYLWSRKREMLARLAEAPLTGSLYRASLHKFYIDEIYAALVINPIKMLSESFLWKGVDVKVIDRAVNLVAEGATGVGRLVRLVQNGNVQFYALFVFIGMAIILWILR